MYWLIWEQYWEADWILWGIINWEDIAVPKSTFWENKYQYNQTSIPDWQNDCTIVSAMWCYGDNMWYKFTEEEHQEIHDLAVEEWLDVDRWRRLHKAIDLVRRYKNDSSSARVSVNSEDFREAINRWFSVQVGYWGNKAYNDAKNDDGVMELKERGTATYYHAIRRVLDNIIVDNYYWNILLD